MQFAQAVLVGQITAYMREQQSVELQHHCAAGVRTVERNKRREQNVHKRKALGISRQAYVAESGGVSRPSGPCARSVDIRYML